MPIEAIPGGGTVYSGPAATNFYRLNVLLHAMRLELRTGMRINRGPSCFTVVKREFGLKGNKQKILEQFTKMVDEENKKMVYTK